MMAQSEITCEVRQALLAAASPWEPASPAQIGLYALFIKPGLSLPHLTIADDGLLYIGMTQTGFAARDHFYPHKGSSSSTLRRTLGAILCEELGLEAYPKGNKGSWQDYYHYHFGTQGEEALSKWMFASVRIARIPFDGNIATAEAMLIRALQPPLNLTGWTNPQKRRIATLRRHRAYEAKRRMNSRTLGAIGSESEVYRIRG